MEAHRSSCSWWGGAWTPGWHPPMGRQSLARWVHHKHDKVVFQANENNSMDRTRDRHFTVGIPLQAHTGPTAHSGCSIIHGTHHLHVEPTYLLWPRDPERFCYTSITNHGNTVHSLPLFSKINLNYLFIFWAWHVGSLFPDQGSNPGPWQWEHGVLTTGPPGNSLKSIFKKIFLNNWS